MPIYQYDCAGCNRRVDVFFRSVNTTTRPTCPECGGKKLKRVMSTFKRGRSTAQRIEEIDQVRESAHAAGSDPANFARWARQAGAEYDEELGTNYRELAEKAESGEEVFERIDADHTFRHRVEMKKAELRGEAPLADEHDHFHQPADHAH